MFSLSMLALEVLEASLTALHHLRLLAFMLMRVLASPLSLSLSLFRFVLSSVGT